MSSAPPARAVLASVLVAAALLVGCGYRFVQADHGPAVRLGVIDDSTPDGDLGLLARDHLRRRARVVREGPIEVRGLVRPGADVPTVIDTAGERVRAVGVVVELTAVDAQGRVLAISGPVARSRPLMLSAEPAGADRRERIVAALGDALDDALDRLIARLPAEVYP